MDALCKIPTMDIPIDVINEFNTIIAPIHNSLYERNIEKRKLHKLRDTLLPLLMNGQVSIMPPEVNCDLYLFQLSILLTFDHILCRSNTA